MLLKILSQTLSLRLARRGIDLAPLEIQNALQELLSQVRVECRLGKMTTEEVYIQMVLSSLQSRGLL